MELVTAIILFRQDGSVLMQKRDNKPNILYSGLWGFPGGHANPGESVEECARRELREETDYDCDHLEPLTVVEDRPEGRPPYSLSVFCGKYDGIQQLRCHEGEELRFVPQSQIGKYPVPSCIVEIWSLILEAWGKRKDISL